MATPLTRAEWLDECAKLAKTYEDAMTDEAKALVERVAMLPDGDAWPSTVELLCDLRDCVETQAREIERLREALTAVYNEGDFASVRIATLALGATYD